MTTHDEGLTFQGSLAVGLVPVAMMPDAPRLQSLNEGNEILLRSLLAMDEKHDLDESDPVTHELRRQDLKLSLVLDMLSALLRQHELIPPLEEVRFSSASFNMRGQTDLAPGTPCRLSLYLDPRLPRPVEFYGTMEPATSAGWTCVRFEGMGQGVVDSIDKFIFRQHRRQVALQRKATSE